MNETLKLSADTVEVLPYDSNWPKAYAVERDLILGACESQLIAIEPIGSTAIPGQRAKPIIDMMAAVQSLGCMGSLIGALNRVQYQVIETGMRDCVFLRKRVFQFVQFYHLHIVEYATWGERKERLMRDYLRAHPEAVKAYGELKDSLAVKYRDDSLAYTRAKTDFIQVILDKARDTSAYHISMFGTTSCVWRCFANGAITSCSSSPYAAATELEHYLSSK